MTKAEAIKRINQVGEDFGWQMGKVGANYENGYMKAIRDCKAVFQKEEQFREDTKKVVTNADRIRNMNEEELRDFLYEMTTENPCCICVFKKGWLCEKPYEESCHDGVMKWLKEKVE